MTNLQNLGGTTSNQQQNQNSVNSQQTQNFQNSNQELEVLDLSFFYAEQKKLDQFLGLSLPTGIKQEEVLLWENFFSIIRLAYQEDILYKQDIPKMINFFQSIPTEEKATFLKNFLRGVDEKIEQKRELQMLYAYNSQINKTQQISNIIFQAYKNLKTEEEKKNFLLMVQELIRLSNEDGYQENLENKELFFETDSEMQELLRELEEIKNNIQAENSEIKLLDYEIEKLKQEIETQEKLKYFLDTQKYKNGLNLSKNENPQTSLDSKTQNIQIQNTYNTPLSKSQIQAILDNLKNQNTQQNNNKKV